MGLINMKQEILKLIERYENKIIWLRNRMVDENHSYYKGMIDGLVTASNDLMDVLNDFELT